MNKLIILNHLIDMKNVAFFLRLYSSGLICSLKELIYVDTVRKDSSTANCPRIEQFRAEGWFYRSILDALNAKSCLHDENINHTRYFIV